MLYVQFYNAPDVAACGDRSVIIYDARSNATAYYRDATEECVKRGYVGFRFFRGLSFTSSAPVSTYRPVLPVMVDKRYAQDMEWCGQPSWKYIARFCGDFLSWHNTKWEALEACQSHLNKRGE